MSGHGEACARQVGEIVLLEDDPRMAREIVLALAGEGYSVRHVTAIEDVINRVRDGSAGLLLLDRMIGSVDSIGVVGALRNEGYRIPVVVVSSMSSVDERIEGLRAGGDDYVIKPFAMGELVARIHALCRRADEGRRITLVVGPLIMDTIGRTVRRGDRPIDLLPREFVLLEYMMRHAGRTLSRSMLLADVWHFNSAVHTNVVEVHVSKLRHKIDLAGEPPMITSTRGVGYRLGDLLAS